MIDDNQNKHVPFYRDITSSSLLHLHKFKSGKATTLNSKALGGRQFFYFFKNRLEIIHRKKRTPPQPPRSFMY
jgi:hypothetical protein